MTIDHYDRARRMIAEQQRIFVKGQAKPRGISDELINCLAISTMVPIEDVRAIANWSVIILMDELKKRC